MRNLAFVLWLVLYPMAMSYGEYVHKITGGKEYPQSFRILGGLLDVALYIWIAVLVYEKRPKEN